jgi:hypothetical protein
VRLLGPSDRFGRELRVTALVADAEDPAWRGRVAGFRDDGEVTVRRDGKDYTCEPEWLVLIPEE